MHALLYYLLLPFIYLLAHLPFRALYILSDGLYYLLRIVGYRKEVILMNLRKAFPNKSQQGIERLFEAYYRYMCDLILETIKTMTLTAKQVREHCMFRQANWLEQMYDKGQSFIIVMGHYGNWELAGPCFTLANRHQLVVIYRPLSNPYFEKLFSSMRTKFGTQIVPAPTTLRTIAANRNKITATAFIADQKAPVEHAYWTTFLNQDTAVFVGAEKVAKKYNYPVVYVSVNKVRRGYYEIVPELLFEHPQEVTLANKISQTFMNRLEKEINQNPVTWLWSHRRWKDKRPSTLSKKE